MKSLKTKTFIIFSLLVIIFTNNAKEYEHWEPGTYLASAVSSGNIERVVELIEEGHDVNEIDSHGRTALMWSCICPSKEIAQILLNTGAQVDLIDENSYSALHLVCEDISQFTPPCITCSDFDIEFIKLLIDAGCDVNISSEEDGLTPLHSAVRTMNKSSEVIAFLLKAGADPNAVYAKAWAPVNLLIYKSSGTTSDIKIFDMLVKAGADPNHYHIYYGPPIVQVVKYGNIKFVRYLINLGVELNTIVSKSLITSDMPEKYTALDVAVLCGFKRIRKMLIAAGALSASELVD